MQDRMGAHGGERAGEPALRRHDGWGGSQACPVESQAVSCLLERRGQQVGPANQRAEIHAYLRGAAGQPAEAGDIEIRTAGSADAGLLYLGIDRVEVGQHPNAGIAL